MKERGSLLRQWGQFRQAASSLYPYSGALVTQQAMRYAELVAGGNPQPTGNPLVDAVGHQDAVKAAKVQAQSLHQTFREREQALLDRNAPWREFAQLWEEEAKQQGEAQQQIWQAERAKRDQEQAALNAEWKRIGRVGTPASPGIQDQKAIQVQALPAAILDYPGSAERGANPPYSSYEPYQGTSWRDITSFDTMLRQFQGQDLMVQEAQAQREQARIAQEVQAQREQKMREQGAREQARIAQEAQAQREQEMREQRAREQRIAQEAQAQREQVVVREQEAREQARIAQEIQAQGEQVVREQERDQELPKLEFNRVAHVSPCNVCGVILPSVSRGYPCPHWCSPVNAEERDQCIDGNYMPDAKRQAWRDAVRADPTVGIAKPRM